VDDEELILLDVIKENEMGGIYRTHMREEN
jgi:hypothetical protein